MNGWILLRRMGATPWDTERDAKVKELSTDTRRIMQIGALKQMQFCKVKYTETYAMKAVRIVK
jgi:hypothetical protein